MKCGSFSEIILGYLRTSRDHMTCACNLNFSDPARSSRVEWRVCGYVCCAFLGNWARGIRLGVRPMNIGTYSQPEVAAPSSWYVGAMEHLVGVVQALSLARDLQLIMDIVRHAARELTGADGATFVLRDGDKCFYAEENAIEPLWKGMRFPLETCVSGWAMINRQAAVIPDIYVDPRIPADAYRPTFVKSLADGADPHHRSDRRHRQLLGEEPPSDARTGEGAADPGRRDRGRHGERGSPQQSREAGGGTHGRAQGDERPPAGRGRAAPAGRGEVPIVSRSPTS